MFEETTGGEGGRHRGSAYLLVIVFVLLQLILGSHISVAGAKPSFMLVLTAALAYMYGVRVGCVAGFACGLLADLTGSGPVGLLALLGCILGYVLGRAQRNVFVDGWRAPLGEFTIAALIYNVAQFALLLMFAADVSLDWTVMVRIVVSTLLDGLVAFITFALLSRLCGGGSFGSGLRLS